MTHQQLALTGATYDASSGKLLLQFHGPLPPVPLPLEVPMANPTLVISPPAYQVTVPGVIAEVRKEASIEYVDDVQGDMLYFWNGTEWEKM